MPLQCVRTESEAITEAVKLISDTNPVYLIDVGASGGIEDHWLNVGSKLVADAFDPLVAEVQRLNSITPPNLKYWEAWVDGGVGSRKAPQLAEEDSYLTAFDRTTASRYNQIKKSDYRQEFFNRGRPLVFSEKSISIDEFISENRKSIPSFIKIDTDGSDFQVLLGARDVLSKFSCLAVQVECQFHGTVKEYSSTFANIDTYLRERGFRLFHLETWKYSRIDLPSRFTYAIPAQTVNGGIQWGEALYMRDPITNSSFSSFLSASADDLAKLVLIAIIMGQDDFAASIVSDLSNHIAEATQATLNKVLDIVTREQHPEFATYQELLDHFNSDPDYFMPRAFEAQGMTHRIRRRIRARVARTLAMGRRRVQ